MVTNEEILSQIELKKQEIALAQQELQNRQQLVIQHNASQQNVVPKESLSKKAFRMFYDFTKPKPKYQSLMNGSGVIDKDKELDYLKKILHKRDTEIRKQRNLITKKNVPKTYIKKDFIKSTDNILKSRGPRVVLRTSTSEPRESWLK